MAEDASVTDYSRFDAIDASDSDNEDSTDSSSGGNSTETVVEKLVRATASKDTGNFAFQRQEWADARAAYEEGIKMLEPHQNAAPPAVTEVQKEEVQKLLCTLHANKAMVLLKLEDWAEAAKAGSAALKIDASNTKALFRRAVAYSRNGMLEESKEDLLQLLNLDPANAPAKKELGGVQKKLQEHRQKQKASFAGLFDRGGGVYEDKEQERIRKERRAEEQRLKQEDDWRKDNIRRRDLGQAEQTFEDWKKQKEQEAKAAEEEAKKKRDDARKKSASSPARQPTKAAGATSEQKESASDSEEDYDEEEKRIINETKQKGYCYFRRQQSAEEKQLLGSIAPQKVDQAGNADADAAVAAEAHAVTPSEQPAKSTGASAWNFAGTFEERDMTAWAKDRLKALCLEAAASDDGVDVHADPQAMVEAMGSLDHGLDSDAQLQQLAALSSSFARVDAKVTKVKKLEGDAQIAVVRGTNRYLFDFNLQLDFEVKIDSQMEGEQPKKLKGTLNFDEISNTTAESEWECRVTWKTAPSTMHSKRAQEVTTKLRHDVFHKVELFAQEYAAL